MKFNSRILFLVLATVMLVALVACGGEKDPSVPSVTTTKAPDKTLPPITLATTTVQGGDTPAVTTAEKPATTTEAPAVTTEAPAVTTEAPAVTTEAPATTTEAPAVTTTATPTTTTTKKTTTTRRPSSPSTPSYPDDDDDEVVTTTKATTTTQSPAVTTTAPVTPPETPESDEFAEKKAEILKNATWGEGGYGYDKIATITEDGIKKISDASKLFIETWKDYAYSSVALSELQKAYNRYVVEVDKIIEDNLTPALKFEREKALILASATWGEGGFRYSEKSKVDADGRSLLGKLAEDFHNEWKDLVYSDTALASLTEAYAAYKQEVNEIFSEYEEQWTKPIK